MVNGNVDSRYLFPEDEDVSQPLDMVYQSALHYLSTLDWSSSENPGENFGRIHFADKSFGYIYTHEEALIEIQTMIEHLEKFENLSETLFK